MTITIFTLFASQISTSSMYVGIVISCLNLPWLLLVLFAGAVVDKCGGKTVAIWANILRVIVFVLLAIASLLNPLSITLLCFIALFAGTAEVLSEISHNVYLTEIVPEQDLELANSFTTSAELACNRFIGVNLGVVVKNISPFFSSLVLSLAYLISPILLLMINAKKQVTYRRKAIKQYQKTQFLDGLKNQIFDGLQFISRNQYLRSMILLGLLFNFALGAQQAYMVNYIKINLNLTDYDYALMISASGLGAIIGGLVVNISINSFGRFITLLLCSVGYLLQYILKFSIADKFFIALCFFIEGLAFIAFSTIAVSFRQRIVPQEMMGRVAAASRLFGLGILPLGSISGGLIADKVGIAPTAYSIGIIFLVLGIYALRPLTILDAKHKV
jgi:MFS family permease